MVNIGNLRENLLKHGWFASPGGINITRTKNTVELDNEVTVNYNEKPKDDIEKLFNMFAPGSRPLKTGKGRGSIDMKTIKEMLLNLGWFKKNDEPTTVDVDTHRSASNDKMTKLDKWFQDYEDSKNQTYIQLSEIPPSTNSDVERTLDMFSSQKMLLQARQNHGTMDKLRFHNSLLSCGWYAVPSNKELYKATTENDKLSISAVSLFKKRGNDANISKQFMAPGRNVMNPTGQEKQQHGSIDMKTIKEMLLNEVWFKQNDEPTTVDVDTLRPASNDKMTKLDKWFQDYEDSKNQTYIPFFKIPPSTNSDVERILDMFSSQIMLLQARQNQEISLKKSKLYNPMINTLLKQGWFITNQSRFEMTVVNINEAQTKLNMASSQKPTPITKRCEHATTEKVNASTVKVNAPVVFDNIFTLLRRLVRRLKEAIGSFFTCGKNAD